MIRKPLCVAVLLAVVAASVATAQDKAGPKLYRWVDKQGKVHYDDALPPEAVNQARREFSARTGTVTGTVDRALTPEERAEQAAAQQVATEAAAKVEEQKRQEAIMMASYATEAELRRAYGERIALLELTLGSTEASIKSLRENLATLLAQASDMELGNRRVLDDRAGTIRQLHTEKMKQEIWQLNRRADLEALNAEFARVLIRYRELRAPRAAPAAPATPTAAVTP